jgi:hypothetical protein
MDITLLNSPVMGSDSTVNTLLFDTLYNNVWTQFKLIIGSPLGFNIYKKPVLKIRMRPSI